MTVLVVDDTDSARDVTQRILRHYGMECIGAESGQDALTLLESMTPDVILLDLAMPDMDGMMVLERLRQDPRWIGIPVIMLSAISDEESVRRAKGLGARDYLVKATFTPPLMLEVVRRHTRKD